MLAKAYSGCLAWRVTLEISVGRAAQLQAGLLQHECSVIHLKVLTFVLCVIVFKYMFFVRLSVASVVTGIHLALLWEADRHSAASRACCGAARTTRASSAENHSPLSS